MPEALIHAVRASRVAIVEADVGVRSRFLLAEYEHFRQDVPALLARLKQLVPLHGAERIRAWTELVEADRWLELVERLLIEHYDPSYDRSMKRNFGRLAEAPQVRLDGTDEAALQSGADTLLRLGAEI